MWEFASLFFSACTRLKNITSNTRETNILMHYGIQRHSQQNVSTGNKVRHSLNKCCMLTSTLFDLFCLIKVTHSYGVKWTYKQVSVARNQLDANRWLRWPQSSMSQIYHRGQALTYQHSSSLQTAYSVAFIVQRFNKILMVFVKDTQKSSVYSLLHEQL